MNRFMEEETIEKTLSLSKCDLKPKKTYDPVKRLIFGGGVSSEPLSARIEATRPEALHYQDETHG